MSNSVSSIYEIIIVDDCSTDKRYLNELPNYIQNHNKKGFIKIKIIKHRQNLGLAKSRNSAINECESEWIAFCDDDDQIATEYALNVKNKISNIPSNVSMILSYDHEMYELLISKFGLSVSLNKLIKMGVCPPASSQVFRVSTIKKTGGYNECITSGVDHDIWISLVSKVDPEVMFVQSTSNKIGDDEIERMTTNEINRRNGIKNSLIFWEGQLVKTFGIDFFVHFSNQYEVYLNYQFLYQAIRRKDSIYIVKKIIRPRVLLSMIRRYFFLRKASISFFEPF